MDAAIRAEVAVASTGWRYCSLGAATIPFSSNKLHTKLLIVLSYQTTLKMAIVSSINACNVINPGNYNLQLRRERFSFNLDCPRFTRSERRAAREQSTLVRVANANQDIDFLDPEGKRHFQNEFEARFNLPHLKELHINFVPSKVIIIGHWRGSRIMYGACDPADRKNDYVNKDDRLLLKFCRKSLGPTHSIL